MSEQAKSPQLPPEKKLFDFFESEMFSDSAAPNEVSKRQLAWAM